MRKRMVLCLALATMLGTQCARRSERIEGVELARVGDNVLYLDDVPGSLFYDVAPQDSVSVLRGYVDKWLRETLIFRMAERSVGKQVESIEAQLEGYRRSLYVYEYEQRYLLNHLDTAVTRQEVESFYATHRESFVLTEPVVRALLVIVPASSPFLGDFRSSYRRIDDEGMQVLSSLSTRSGVLLRCLPEEWVALSSIERQLPNGIDPNWTSRQARHLEVMDANDVYLVSFREWGMPGSVAPLDYVYQSVRNMILTRREVELLQELESRIVQEAISGGVAKVSL